MNTTNLFVELIVIGAGALCWLLLLTGALFGFAWLPLEFLASPAALVPLLAIVYLLGIASDRIADTLMESIWTDRVRKKHFPEKHDYYETRRIILTKSESLSRLLEYGRSRLRICRGRVLNSLLIAVTLNLYLWTQASGETYIRPASIYGTGMILLLTAACWYTWRKLLDTEYIKIAEQAAFLQSHQKEGATAE